MDDCFSGHLSHSFSRFFVCFSALSREDEAVLRSYGGKGRSLTNAYASAIFKAHLKGFVLWDRFAQRGGATLSLSEKVERELAFFARTDHPQSFELLTGRGRVLFSAPHAVLQTRMGALKYAERFTGMLCRLVHEQAGYPVMYKTQNLNDDANFDEVSDYRDELCRYVRKNGILCVVDLHQMKPERPLHLCIGTGYGGNLAGRVELTDTVLRCMREHGVARLALDEPFSASRPQTVSATVAATCGIPAFQLEWNTRLLMNGYPEYAFDRVLQALCDLAGRLETEIGQPWKEKVPL